MKGIHVRCRTEQTGKETAPSAQPSQTSQPAAKAAAPTAPAKPKVSGSVWNKPPGLPEPEKGQKEDSPTPAESNPKADSSAQKLERKPQGAKVGVQTSQSLTTKEPNGSSNGSDRDPKDSKDKKVGRSKQSEEKKDEWKDKKDEWWLS